MLSFEWWPRSQPAWLSAGERVVGWFDLTGVANANFLLFLLTAVAFDSCMTKPYDNGKTWLICV